MSSTFWDCGLEPLSEWLSDDECLFINNDDRNKEFCSTSLKLTRSEIAEQTLNEIENFAKKENNYWLEEIPLFEEIQSIIPNDSKSETGLVLQDICLKQCQEQQPSYNYHTTKASGNLSNFQELNGTTYENSKLICSDENILLVDREPFINITSFQNEPTMKPLQNEMFEKFPTKSNEQNVLNPFFESCFQSAISPDAFDFKKEKALADEIIKNAILKFDQWESDGSLSEMSLDASVASQSPPSSTHEIESDDPEWKPEYVKYSNKKKNHNNNSKSNPDGKNQDIKRLRKKEQNKNAAIRYRQKKKAEVSEIIKEEERLKEKKANLEEKVFEIQNEIKYLKGLMRDIFKIKGLI